MLIRLLKKYLNPHENSCSKFIRILTTGNILHESSSTPRQHKSVHFVLTPRYFAYRHAAITFISCRGVLGTGGNMCGSRNFCQFYLVLSLFYSLQRGSNSFIAEKTILILYQGSRGGPLFFRGDVKLFPGGGGGSNANFFRNPYTYLLFSRGGGCPDPISPLDPHMGNVIITGRYLPQSRF